GSIGLEMMKVTDKFEILKTSLEFKLASLIKYVQANLVRNSGSWVQSSFAHSYQLIIENDGLDEFRQFCDEIFKSYPNMIFLSEDFITLQEHILISILKREDIQPDESLVLDKILLWGKARTPNLPTNIRQWTSWDYLSLKATLQNLLPFIKCAQNRNNPKKSYEPPNKSNVYKHIPDNDVWESILERCSIQSQPPPNLTPSNLPHSNLPPSNLLPSNLSPSNLPPSNLPPPKRMRMGSSVVQSSPSHSYSIITLQHLAEISSWIDRRSTAYEISNIPYGFRLLFKSSKHGFSTDAFHKLCDNIQSTMIVGRVRGTNELIGGYNPLTWKTNEYKPDDFAETEDSFIFSLQINNDDGEPSILSRVNNSSKAINHYTSA
ncbi:10308_t:CDS:1, partial [Gigaspora rosea]